MAFLVGARQRQDSQRHPFYTVIARNVVSKTPLLRSEQAPQSPRARRYKGAPCHCEESFFKEGRRGNLRVLVGTKGHRVIANVVKQSPRACRYFTEDGEIAASARGGLAMT